MRVVIGDREFASKAKALEHIREILYRYKIGQVVDDEEDEDFLLDLFQLHPRWKEKWGPGVRSIRVEKNEPYGTRGFWIERFDRTRVDISLMKALNHFKQKGGSR